MGGGKTLLCVILLYEAWFSCSSLYSCLSGCLQLNQKDAIQRKDQAEQGGEETQEAAEISRFKAVRSVSSLSARPVTETHCQKRKRVLRERGEAARIALRTGARQARCFSQNRNRHSKQRPSPCHAQRFRLPLQKASAFCHVFDEAVV